MEVGGAGTGGAGVAAVDVEGHVAGPVDGEGADLARDGLGEEATGVGDEAEVSVMPTLVGGAARVGGVEAAGSLDGAVVEARE